MKNISHNSDPFLVVLTLLCGIPSEVSLFPYVIRGQLTYFQILDSLCGQGEEPAYEVNLTAVASCSLTGIMGWSSGIMGWSSVHVLGFFQIKWNCCFSGAW